MAGRSGEGACAREVGGEGTSGSGGGMQDGRISGRCISRGWNSARGVNNCAHGGLERECGPAGGVEVFVVCSARVIGG